MCKDFVSQCAEMNEELRADITVSIIVITARY